MRLLPAVEGAVRHGIPRRGSPSWPHVGACFEFVSVADGLLTLAARPSRFNGTRFR